MSLERLLTVKQVCELEGCGPTSVYDRLIKGEYEAFKDGPKKTLITSSSVARRRERLRKAEFGSGQNLPPQIKRARAEGAAS